MSRKSRNVLRDSVTQCRGPATPLHTALDSLDTCDEVQTLYEDQ